MKRSIVTFGHLPYVGVPPSGAQRYDDFGLEMMGLWGLRKMRDDYVGPLARVRNTATAAELDLFAGEDGIITFEDATATEGGVSWQVLTTPGDAGQESAGWSNETFRIKVPLSAISSTVPLKMKIKLENGFGPVMTVKSSVALLSGTDLDIVTPSVPIFFGGQNPATFSPARTQKVSDAFDLPAGTTINSVLVFSFLYNGDIGKANNMPGYLGRGYKTGDYTDTSSFAPYNNTGGTNNTILEIRGLVEDANPPDPAWAVVKMYDQSGYDQHLVQQNEDSQPLLLRNQFPNGNPGIVFDGVDDFLIDMDTTTNTRSYMVPDPVWVIMGRNFTQKKDYPTIAQIPHQNNQDVNPYTRVGAVLRALTGTGFALSVKAGGVEREDYRFINIERDTGIFALSCQFKGNRIRVTGADSQNAPTTADTTYPNPTGLYVGVSGNKTTGNWYGALFEIGIMKGQAVNGEDFEITKDKMAAKCIYGDFRMFIYVPMTTTDSSANYSAAELQLRQETGGDNILLNPITTAGTVRFSASESWGNVFDGDPATIWSANSAFWPVLCAIIREPEEVSLPIEGTHIWRNDQYYNGSTRTFYLLTLASNGWYKSANVDLGAPAVQGQSRGFTLNWTLQ